MFSAFSKAFAQLSDPRLLRVILWGVLAALILYGGLIGAVAWLLTQPWVKDLPLVGTIVAWSAGFAAVVIATLLFPGLVSALVGLWLEEVAAAVEARHYPHLAAPRRVPVGEVVSASLRLAALTVSINLILLPLYLVLFFVPPLNLVVYYTVNGRLLGREYFETVALCRVDLAAARNLRQENAGTVWFAGVLAAVLLTVPLLNMVAPVVGAAAMVHLFQKLTART